MEYTLIVKNVPHITKKDINLGLYPSELSILSFFFRNIFLLSNSIRKENNLNILCTDQFETGKKSLFITINGESLRYLSPDERNSLFLMQKIIGVITKASNTKIYRNQIINFHNDKWANSTPGIRFKRCELDTFFKSLEKKELILLNLNNSHLNLLKEYKIEHISNIKQVSKEIRKNSQLYTIIGEDLDFLKNLLICHLNYNITLRYYYVNHMIQNFFSWELILILHAIYSEVDSDNKEKIID